ncbi:MAG: 3-dehydroquinate synthase [Salinispira sp.]
MKKQSKNEKFHNLHFELGDFSTTISFHSSADTLLAFGNINWVLICDESMVNRVRTFMPDTQNLEDVPLLKCPADLESLSRADTIDTPAKTGLRGIIALPAGEGAKSMEWIEFMLNAAFALKLSRDSMFAALGGGALSDAAAFAASIFLRGITLIIIPSTLLAMVDAAFGGKTGINYIGFKNMVGTIYPANELRICPALIESLPQREYLSGLAEVIKAAMLNDAVLLEFLEERHADIINRDKDCLFEIIRRSLGVKGAVVTKDLREGGLRAHLNLGHTFAHALEAVDTFSTWKHGEAVAWGIFRALILGEFLKETDGAYRNRITRLLQLYGYRLNVDSIADDALLAAMKRDKKHMRGEVRFVLQHGQGETFQRTASDSSVLAALQYKV